MIEITDHDIRYAERILLPEEASFNNERRKFIQCMKSRDVVACPGSGKTTALLAKLLILATKMPLEDGRGICVLTHTNVGINEIKCRAGTIADNLFRHPNFFGTIQSFVNRFLAIPAYRNEFGQPVHSIDLEKFYDELEYHYSRSRLHSWLEPRGGLAKLGAYWLQPDLNVGSDIANEIPRLSRTTDTYKRIKAIREILLKKGILSYNDAFSLAIRSLVAFPVLVNTFFERFQFVFVDEMQDTDIHQLKVLNQIFCNDQIVLQCLGDSNQAIYRFTAQKEMHWKPAGNPPMTFSDTMRYGAHIANLLNTVCVDRTISLQPNAARDSLQPHLLLFNEGEEEKVIPAFGRLISHYNLHKVPESLFKAVGWVGKDKREEKKLCIPYYFPSFDRTPPNKKERFANLLSYISAASATPKNDNAGVYRHNILRGIVHALTIANFKNPDNDRYFTVHSFISNMKADREGLYHLMLHKLSVWILRYRRELLTDECIRDKIAVFFRKVFSKVDSNTWNDFLDSDDGIIAVDSIKKQQNTYLTDDGVEICVDTVHSVKGETHTATLYLETFNHAPDSQRLLPFLKGQYPEADSKKSRHIENLKVAHVAFSRSTHLIAFACQADGICGHETELEDNRWKIMYVKKILQEEIP